jgi:hypothetical protein
MQAICDGWGYYVEWDMLSTCNMAQGDQGPQIGIAKKKS